MDIVDLTEIISFLELDFRVTEKLPASGQRVVFYGCQVSTGINCIVKICALNPITVGRIQREIRILGEMDSPHFPKMLHQTFITASILSDFYDSFDLREKEQEQRLVVLQSKSLKPFLLTVEERIDFVLWEDVIDDLRNEATLVELLFQLFSALSLLWNAQIVHRDLKPDNILLRADLQPVIIDLGIAKSFRPGTQEFTVLGTPCTPRYAAPEQLTNTKTDITYKTDQFSVGVIAYNILTGQFPYGDVCKIEGQILDNFSKGALVPVHTYSDGIDEELANFIEKLLQVHPYKRFRSIKTILEKLKEIRGSIV